MVKLTTAEAMQKAIDKARAVKPRVRVVCFGSYIVTNKQTGASYTVTCERETASGSRTVIARRAHAASGAITSRRRLAHTSNSPPNAPQRAAKRNRPRRCYEHRRGFHLSIVRVSKHSKG